MTSDDQEASGEVAVVVDKVDTAAAVQIAAASKEKLDEMEKLKRSLNSRKSVTTRSLKRLETAIETFRESSAKSESAMTLAEKNLVKESAKEVIESRDKERSRNTI